MAKITKTSATAVISPDSVGLNQTTAGNDLIIANTAALLGRSAIDGGAGTDELRLGGATAAAQAFVVGANVTNIEAIVIANTEPDTSEVAIPSTANHSVNASAVVGNVSITGNNGNNVLTGGAGNNVISGGLGNDTINGGAGTDALLGGDGNDVFLIANVTDFTFNETISGGNQLDGGADQIRITSTTAGNITFGGNITGIETISVANAAGAATGNAAINVNATLVQGPITLTGNAAANSLTATNFDDSVSGGAGNDLLSGGSGNDTLNGGAGKDSLFGGSGNDTYIYSSAAEFAAGESITDTSGFDTLQHNGTGVITLNSGVTGLDRIKIGANSDTRNAGGINASAFTSEDSGLDIYGNNGANNITGTSGNDDIYGYGGADTLRGGQGNDNIYGDSTDLIDGGDNFDPQYGGGDTLYINANYTQANNARLVGIEEIQINTSGNININLTGQTEGFKISDNNNNNSITGGSGNDYIESYYGDDTLVGGAGNDTIFSSYGADSVLAGAGDDIVYGGNDEDSKLDGGAGVDTLYIDDTFFVATSDAFLVGFENVILDNDSSYGTVDLSNQTEGFNITVQNPFRGTDYDIYGGSGADNIITAYGDDEVTAGAGADTISAGYGDDTIYINSVADYAVGEIIDGGYGSDEIRFNLGESDAGASIQLVDVTGIEEVTLLGEVDANLDASLVNVSYGYGLEITGNSGNNFIIASSGSDFVYGGNGNDTIIGGDDNGDYGDIIAFSGSIDDYTIVADSGVYTITGNNQTDIFTGFESVLFFNSGIYNINELNIPEALDIPIEELANANNVLGTYGSDFISTGEGNDTVDGIAGNDIINTGAGDDTVNYDLQFGGEDSIDGGTGVDTLNISANASQVRISFVSGEVGNGNTQNATAAAAGDYYGGSEGGAGGLAVRIQAEFNVDGSLFGNIGRSDDEGVSFVAEEGTTFDVRDFVTGAQRGNQFNVVTLGTNGADVFDETDEFENYYINGGQGDDSITGGYGGDFLVGGAGNDTLTGAFGSDTFIGGGGNDVIFGGDGDDLITGAAVSNASYNLASDGADSIDGGAGLDYVNVSSTGATQIRVTFTSAEVGDGFALQDGNASGLLTNQTANTLAVSLQAEDAMGNVAGTIARVDDEGVVFNSITGTTFDVRDLVTGAARGDMFNTVVLGTANSDSLSATQLGMLVTDNYYINAGAGNDFIYGESGNDFLVGGSGDDLANGYGGDDSFIGGIGNDSIFGGEGEDTVVAYNLATDGTDQIDLGAGFDTVNVSSTGATQIRISFVSAEVGNGNTQNATASTAGDYNGAASGGLAVRLEAENAEGSLLVTTVNGDTADAIGRTDDEGITYVAAAGTTFDVRDFANGAARGDQFNEVTLGTIDADYIDESESDGVNYYINAGMGNDVILTGDGNDFLVGGAGDDTLIAGSGSDSFIGGNGNDFITGGIGGDNVNLTETVAGIDTIFQGLEDGIATLGYIDVVPGGDGNGDTITLAATTDIVTAFTAGSDVLQFGSFLTLDETYGEAVADNSYAILRGDFLNNVFTLSETGTASLVVYDADDTAGVSEHSVLFIGSILTTDDIQLPA